MRLAAVTKFEEMKPKYHTSNHPESFNRVLLTCLLESTCNCEVKIGQCVNLSQAVFPVTGRPRYQTVF